MSKKYGIKQSLEKMSVKYIPPKIEEPKRPDNICAPCSRERKVHEATNYCPDCNEKLCMSCVNQHGKFQILKTHKILPVSEAPKQEVEVIETPKLTDMCETHANKVLELYCPNHDEIGCAVCIATKHKECKEAIHIVEASKGLSKTPNVKETKDEIDTVKKDIFMVKLKRLGDKRRFKKEHDDILTTIDALRARINEHFDRLEHNAKQKLKLKYDRDLKGIARDVKKCEDALASLDEAMKKMKADNDVQLFINIKKDAKKSIKRGQSIIQPVTEHIGRETVNFAIDESIEEWLNDLSALGKFDHDQAVNKGAILNEIDLDLKSDSVKVNYVFNDIENLPDGNIVITDWNNRRLKLVDVNYKLKGHCDLPGEPYGVCHINNNLVAATLRDEKVVQFVGIDNGSMKMEKRLKLDEYCRGIAHYDNKLYITVGGGEGEIHGQLRVYSLEGELIKVYEEDVQSKPLFSLPTGVVISNDGSRFFVADSKRGVVIMTKDSRMLSVFQDTTLKGPLSLCLSGLIGDLFVSGCESSNVFQITIDGEKMGEAINETEGLNRPLAICCHESPDTRILATTEGSAAMKVFTLEEH